MSHNEELATNTPTGQITTRRHPLAIGTYALTFALALVFTLHWYGTGRTERELFPGIPALVIWSWKLELLLGSAAALLAVAARPRITPHWPDLADLLHLEAMGASLSAIGVLTYLAAIVDLVGVDRAGPSIAVYGTLIVARIWRAVEATRQGRTLALMAQVLQDATERHDTP